VSEALKECSVINRQTDLLVENVLQSHAKIERID